MAFERFSMPAAMRGPAMGLLSMGLLSMSLLAILSTVGCASAGNTPALGREVTLQPGEQLALPDDASLRYLAVTADSRCPPGVQCIRAGDADVAFEFVSRQRQATTIALNTVESPTATIGPWQVQLVSLEFGDAPGVTIKVEARVE